MSIKVKAISFSSVNSYIACPMRIKYEKILLLPKRQSMTLKMLFGTALHCSLSSYFRAVANKISLDLDTLLKVFRIRYEAWPSNDLVPDDESNDDVFAQARTLLEQFLAMPQPKTVIAVEKPMRFALTHSLNVVCQPDLVVRDEQGTLTVIDWKSSSKAYAADQIRKVTEQTFLYAMGWHESVQAKAILLLRKKKPDVQELTLDLDSIDLDEIIERFVGVAKAIETGIFYRNRSWMCNSGCPYAYICSKEQAAPEQEYKEAA